MGRWIGVLAAAVLLAACGGEAATPAGGPTDPTTSTTPTSNPCLPQGGPEQPADVAAVTDAFVGLSAKEAKALARDQGQTTRVAGRDGECFALTLDYRSDRVNLYLEQGVVVAATIG